MPGRGHRHNLQGVPVIVVENVQDYRECVPFYVTKNDIVLEAGAAQGCTTSVIANHAGETIGIDKSPYNTRVAQKRYPNIQFYEIDAADISAIQNLGKRFTKICIDISGSQPIGPIATLLEKYERAFPTVNLFIVKSYRLKRLVGGSTIFPEQVLGTTRNHTAKYMMRTTEGERPSSPSAEHNRLFDALKQLASAGIALAAFGTGMALASLRHPRRL